MGQIEVYEWLKTRRLLGDDKYHSVREISKQLKSYVPHVSLDVAILYDYGYLDAKMYGSLFGNRCRKVRLKMKYVKS